MNTRFFRPRGRPGRAGRTRGSRCSSSRPPPPSRIGLRPRDRAELLISVAEDRAPSPHEYDAKRRFVRHADSPNPLSVLLYRLAAPAATRRGS